MRWESKTKNYIELGETKVVTKFLIVPIKIGKTWRWLETATIKYMWTDKYHHDGTEPGYYTYYWKPIEFIS